MAKKKVYNELSSAMEEYKLPDNNPSSGLCPMPNEQLNGNSDPMILKRFCEAVAPGEGANAPDVTVHTPSGVSHSFGKNKNRQYNYGNGSDGQWNNNDFEGGNLSGTRAEL